MKRLKGIIFILFLFALSFLTKTVNAHIYFSFQQVAQKADTSRKAEESVDKVQYAAVDSSYTDKKTGIVYLFGNAKVTAQGFELQADYIRYDSKNEVIFARGVKTKDNRYVGRPIFKSEADGTGIADSVFYNNNTHQGIIYGIYTAQQGGFFSGGKSKVHDDEVHMKGQTFSTCNLPHPHFGIHITRGIVAKNQIITGPAYLEIEDIPMPLLLPFGFFPKPNQKSSGFILPMPNQDQTRGFSLNGGGYYMAFNDHIDGRLITNIYTNGSYDLNYSSQYLTRYKYNGNLSLSYSSTRNGLEGTPEYKPQKNFNIAWQHTQNANAHPGTTFSASVNAGTSNFFTATADQGNYRVDALVSNSMASSIAYGKVFGNGRFNFNAALNHSQEIQAKTITLTLPQISLNMSTFNPFDSKNRVDKQKWYQKISVGYSMQASNRVSTKEDLLFDKGGLKRFNNGVSHTIPINMNFNLLNYFNFNASTNYNERWYFRTVNQRQIRPDSIARDTINGFKRSGEYNLGISMSTKLYGRKYFSHMGALKAISHVITPNFSFSYKPDFSAAKYGYYKPMYYYTNDPRPGQSQPVDGKPILDYRGEPMLYSIFDGAEFGGPSRGRQANLNFGIDNNVEIKVKSKKDTLNGGEKKLAIIQGLSFSGSYNFAAASKKLSNIGFNGRSQLSDKLGFNFGGSFSPYLVGDIPVPSTSGSSSGTYIGETDRYVFSVGKLPRLTSFNLSFDYSLNPDAFKNHSKNLNDMNNQMPTSARTPDQQRELEAISRDPNAFVDFNVPWNFAFSYSFRYDNALGLKSTRSTTNTLNFNGDVNLTPKWKVQFTSGWDFKANTFSYTSFSIYRDLHCWNLNANWIPFGSYASYSITIQVKEAILQDLKLSKRKGYYTKY